MRIIKYWLVLSLALLATMLSAPNKASAIPLSTLVAGGSITVNFNGGQKLFDNWQVNVNAILGSEARAAFNLANIDVTALHDPGGLNPGLLFTSLANELTVLQNGGVPVDADLTYQFDLTELNPAFSWVDNTLEAPSGYFETVGAFGTNDHAAHVHEQIFTDATLSTLVADKDIHLIRDDGIPLFINDPGPDSIPNLNPLVSAGGTIQKTIELTTFTLNESVGIPEIEQRFSQSPEPATWALTGLGLLGVGYRRRRKQRKEKSASEAKAAS